ncbi:MAG: nucleotidyltransferase domain-containing protein [Nanoarchaeota archaeon]|nr:nucleotidyltransferase domain-containing protein [Nanoarchaeota archaeon]
MTTLLKPGNEKVLRIFYENKGNSFHLRELARKTKLYGQSITRYLNQLEKVDILKSEKEGNLKKYSLKKNKQVYAALALFDIEKYERLSSIRKNAIASYLSMLKEKPVFVVLFGSTGKETYRSDSDIDLLIITNRKIETKAAEKEADMLTSVKISTFQMIYSEFIKEIKMKEDLVVQSAMFSGYPVINHIAYYEALNERV